MSELTKCWLQQAITGIETIRDDMPFGLDEDEQKTLAALKMALSVLDAQEKPVAWCQHGLSPVFTANKSEADYWVSRGWGVTPLYATPPAASVHSNYKLVPFQPTKEMITAGQDKLDDCIDYGFDSGEDGSTYEYSKLSSDAPHQIYSAMLAAAPAPGGDQ